MIIPPRKASEGNAPKKQEGTPLKKVPQQFSPQGFGKAGNNAMDIMISKGYFQDKAIEDFDLGVYKELTKRIYKADQEAAEEIKGEQ